MRFLFLVCLSTSLHAQTDRVEAAQAWATRYTITLPVAQAVMDAADHNKIPRPLAFALVDQESRFNPCARSSSGALGLTQLLWSTARDLDPTVTRTQLLEPVRNAQLGMRYFRQMLDRYMQDPRLALIAYNSGMRVADSLAVLYTTPYAKQVLKRAAR